MRTDSNALGLLVSEGECAAGASDDPASACALRGGDASSVLALRDLLGEGDGVLLVDEEGADLSLNVAGVCHGD